MACPVSLVSKLTKALSHWMTVLGFVRWGSATRWAEVVNGLVVLGCLVACRFQNSEDKRLECSAIAGEGTPGVALHDEVLVIAIAQAAFRSLEPAHSRHEDGLSHRRVLADHREHLPGVCQWGDGGLGRVQLACGDTPVELVQQAGVP